MALKIGADLEARVTAARKLITEFHAAQEAACNEDGEVVDQYAFDSAYSNFGEDALEHLELVLDQLDEVK